MFNFLKKNAKEDIDLFKRDDGKKTLNSSDKKIENHKKLLKELCDLFLTDTSSYDPKDSVLKINEFLEQKEKMERIFYSEISYFIFNLDVEKRGKFTTNIDNLLCALCHNESLVFDKEYEDERKKDIIKIIIKFYDHSHLVINQIENAQNIIASTISEAKEEIKKEVKGIEREYISILGIFASIMLAFVGGITFSTSILENIHKASIYRIIFVTSILSLTLVNIFYILIFFLTSINNMDKKIILPKGIYRTINMIILVIMLLDVICWIINFQMYQRNTPISCIFDFLN